MAIEHARIQAVRKPWGSTDLRPWNDMHDDARIGEIWFQRNKIHASPTVLLLKLLFTNERLSIQVHPDDAFARSIGLDHGKSEAWYILAAAPGAKIAVGLKRQLTTPQLRSSIEDGSISELILWRQVRKDDFIFVPAGTIHAIGAGLVIAEIQQRSDATFRLFDFGRDRELHVEQAVAVATAGPEQCGPVSRRLTEARTLLVASPHFVLERIDLSARSTGEIRAEHETWLLVLDGDARIGTFNPFPGEAIFLDAARAKIEAGDSGFVGLLAYPGPEVAPNLLVNLVPGVEPSIGEFLRPGIHHRHTAGRQTYSSEVLT
jgi:mannose-6-phosphate isomerase